MATVSILFRKDKINKKGEAPIHFRIVKNRKNTNISTGIMIPEDCWDEKNKRVKSKHPNSTRMNALISNKFREVMDSILEHETYNKSTTTRQLKEAAHGKTPTDFFEFAEQVLKRFETNGQISTLDKNRSTIKKFKAFFKKGETIYFQHITPQLLQKYEAYLRKEHGNTTNTIHKNLKFIRQLFNEAIHQDIIEIQMNPFNKYKLRLEKTQRTYLTEEELKEFEKVTTEPKSTKEVSKDMFVFASYSGGPRVSDVLSLQWKNFDGEYVAFIIKKTNQQITIKVPNKGLEILNKYKKDGQKPTDFIFPLFPNDLNLNDPRALDGMISKKTALVNKYLKELATEAKINKNLSFHISRHTWATRALRKGISIDKVSKLMGHSAIKETQVYAKIVSEELDKAMDVFND